MTQPQEPAVGAATNIPIELLTSIRAETLLMISFIKSSGTSRIRRCGSVRYLDWHPRIRFSYSVPERPFARDACIASDRAHIFSMVSSSVIPPRTLSYQTPISHISRPVSSACARSFSAVRKGTEGSSWDVTGSTGSRKMARCTTGMA